LAPFRKLSDLELDALTDDELVAYLVQARALGEIDCARTALQIPRSSVPSRRGRG
jgi:hypothetical protein